MNSFCLSPYGVDPFFKTAIQKHICQDPAKYANATAPPIQVGGQVYNSAVEKWLTVINSYRKLHLPFITESNLPIAKCIRGNLSLEHYSLEQFAWSSPKIWKSPHKYSHVSNSSTHKEHEDKSEEIEDIKR